MPQVFKHLSRVLGHGVVETALIWMRQDYGHFHGGVSRNKLGEGARGFHRRDACATCPCPLPQAPTPNRLWLFILSGEAGPRPRLPRQALIGGWEGRVGDPQVPQPSPQNTLPFKLKNLAVHPPSSPPQSEGWPGGLRISSRHDTNRLVYRCFLPDLTGFTSVCCVGSNPPPWSAPAGCAATLKKGLQPRVSGFRVTGHR